MYAVGFSDQKSYCTHDIFSEIRTAYFEIPTTGGRTKKKVVGGRQPRRRKRRDFDAKYYMGFHNRSEGKIPPSSSQ